MEITCASARAHPNIAFVKYWGNRDDLLRIPRNGSISMNLAELHTTTEVRFDPSLPADTLSIDDQSQSGAPLLRVSRFLDVIRRMASIKSFAAVTSANNFPTGAGIASSASAFAALAYAGSNAAGLELDSIALSRLARLGSGSACRSIPSGFVEWLPGIGEQDSYAVSIAPPSHWDLLDIIAIVERGPKATGSTEGHTLAKTSPLQEARVQDTPRRLQLCKSAILQRDFSTLAEIIELDSNLMHAVMMTSHPPLFYWQPISLELMQAIPCWRAQGIAAAYTLDAGPNVHIVCLPESVNDIIAKLNGLPGIQQLFICHPGGPAHIITT